MFIVTDTMAFWLGGTDTTIEGRWEWVTGRCNFSFTDWHANQPSWQDYLGLRNFDGIYGWNTIEHTISRTFVCEFI